MLIGYARVSTKDQDRALQLDALKAAGCEKIFEETASGAKTDRPELAAALGFMRESDTLVVWKLDRLARSMRQLIETIEDLRARKIGFRSLTENMVFGGQSGDRRAIHRLSAGSCLFTCPKTVCLKTCAI